MAGIKKEIGIKPYIKWLNSATIKLDSSINGQTSYFIFEYR